MTRTQATQFSSLLHAQGFKATPGRIALLEVLADSSRPLSTPDIVKQLGRHSDQSTVYRGLDSLSDTGLIRRVDMQHAHAHYELSIGKAHHHHIICRECHKTEDITDCTVVAPEQTVLRRSRMFAEIENHALEFFGTCKECALKPSPRRAQSPSLQ